MFIHSNANNETALFLQHIQKFFINLVRLHCVEEEEEEKKN